MVKLTAHTILIASGFYITYLGVSMDSVCLGFIGLMLSGAALAPVFLEE